MKTCPGIEILTSDEDFGRYLQVALLQNGRPALPVKVEFGPELQPDDYFTPMTPWLSLPREVAIKLFQALGEALHGVKLKTQVELEATLAATEAHLRDMRHLLKLPHPDIIKGGKKT